MHECWIALDSPLGPTWLLQKFAEPKAGPERHGSQARVRLRKQRTHQHSGCAEAICGDSPHNALNTAFGKMGVALVRKDHTVLDRHAERVKRHSIDFLLSIGCKCRREGCFLEFDKNLTLARPAQLAADMAPAS